MNKRGFITGNVFLFVFILVLKLSLIFGVGFGIYKGFVYVRDYGAKSIAHELMEGRDQ
jgi:hypothetical protein